MGSLETHETWSRARPVETQKTLELGGSSGDGRLREISSRTSL